jgi:hypothetical protein
MTRKKWLISALTIGAACGLAGTMGALPAVGQSSPPSSPVVMGSSAHILFHGAAAKAFAYVVCQPGDYANLTISLTERSGRGIASGTATQYPINCTGQIETITLPVPASGKPFVKGTALGQATLYDCGYYFCGQATAYHSVNLKTVPR